MRQEKASIIPVIIMAAFIFVLIGLLALRVYQSDRDLAFLRICRSQARLAAESGISFAIEEMKRVLKQSDRAGNPNYLTHLFFAKLESDSWVCCSRKNKAYFRITSIKKLETPDIEQTTLQNESLRYRIMTEGKCGSFMYSSVGVVQLYDLVETFAAVSALNDYYYGTPLQQWVENAEGFNRFVEANQALFDSGQISGRGVAHDPSIIYKIFKKDGEDFFTPVQGHPGFVSNYGAVYAKSGESPVNGPIYCDTPVIVDSHTFFAPVQTALYFYRRGGSRPMIKSSNVSVAMNSSVRIQHAADSLQGNNPPDMFVDADSEGYCPYLPPWRPDIDYLRELCKAKGIYIDKNGKGFLRGNELDIDYHPAEGEFFSDTYFSQTSSHLEQDHLECSYITLSSENNFGGFNNISGENLNGAELLFSERSIFMRGDIGSDLVIITPGHIFITGPTNVDSNLSLFLVAANGTALSTSDLEAKVASLDVNKSERFIEAAREWHIRAAVYKPGAGVYTSRVKKSNGKPVNFRGIIKGRSLKIHLQGSCIGGSLVRWINNTESGSFKLTHAPQCADRLFVRPFSIALYKERTQQVN